MAARGSLFRQPVGLEIVLRHAAARGIEYGKKERSLRVVPIGREFEILCGACGIDAAHPA